MNLTTLCYLNYMYVTTFVYAYILWQLILNVYNNAILILQNADEHCRFAVIPIRVNYYYYYYLLIINVMILLYTKNI